MSIWRVIRTRYGNVRLDFGQPFSLQVGFIYCKLFFVNWGTTSTSVTISSDILQYMFCLSFFTSMRDLKKHQILNEVKQVTHIVKRHTLLGWPKGVCGRITKCFISCSQTH